MNALPKCLPRALTLERFLTDPFASLACARREFGDAFAIQESGPIFSRAEHCSGVVAVFGEERQRQVLGDIDTFAMPQSAARKLALPENLVNLNRGLHSMCGDEHARQKRMVASVLRSTLLGACRTEVPVAVNDFAEAWNPGNRIFLVDEMRRLTLCIASRVLLGRPVNENNELASLLHAYFILRREVSSPFVASQPGSLSQLTEIGKRLDRQLRERIRHYRRIGSEAQGSLLQLLANAGTSGIPAFTEDEIVGHTNVLFVSSTEPVAISLTWLFLVLTQLPKLRRDLRAEIACKHESSTTTHTTSLMDNVVNETLRLVTPNALMVRITSRAVSLQGVPLPRNSEVVLCPFLAHREPGLFPDPSIFLPERWNTVRPSPYEYFPFGAGGHTCVGQSLALLLIKSTLCALVRRFDLVLATDAPIDWRVHIQLMPRNDPELVVHRPAASINTVSPRLCGPVSQLIQFGPGYC